MIKANLTDQLMARRGYSIVGEYLAILDRFGFPADGPVLELGTGSGRMTGVLAERGLELLSGDLDRSAFRRALGTMGEESWRRVRFVQLDIAALPFPDRAFRHVITASTIHELDRPADALAEMARVCHGSGRLLVLDYHESGLDVIGEVHREVYGDEHNRGRMDEDEVVDFLRGKFSRVSRLRLDLFYAVAARGPL